MPLRPGGVELRRHELPQPRDEVFAVVAAHRLVADALDDLLDARFERGAALRRVERGRLGLARPQHVGEPARTAEHLGNRLAPARLVEIVGILPLGQQREAHALAGHEAGQRHVDRPIGGALSGLVAVEAKDRLLVHLPEETELLLGERGAERRDRGGVARRHHRDDVDIAFDHDQLRAVVRRLPGRRAVVEVVTLVKERRLRRVEVLRRRVLIERAAAERDDAAAEIGDREHHAVAEAVVRHRDVIAVDQEPRLDHVFDRHALLAEMLLQRVTLVRRVAHAELELRRAVEPPVGEIAARLGAQRARRASPRRTSPQSPSRHAATCASPRAQPLPWSISAAPRRPWRRAARRPRGTRRPRSPSRNRRCCRSCCDEKSNHAAFWSLTKNEAVFSLLKGDRPFHSRPAFFNATRRPTTSETGSRAFSSSRNCGVKRMVGTPGSGGFSGLAPNRYTIIGRQIGRLSGPPTPARNRDGITRIFRVIHRPRPQPILDRGHRAA